MYNETVLDHFKNPRNTGDMANPDGIGEVGNPACGDVMRLFIKVEDDRLIDIKCQTFGCAAAIACSSALRSAEKNRHARAVVFQRGMWPK